ncbi:bacteriohemerythrin [Pseudothauera rhizosphaerae]|uniref:Bacteriohemerythrin n=1 Tax=Pseudothauera rhizosphaerae TaxID=2565932 RepID=A0A4S4ATM1_9RHOO|nr:bacteriohemerythrin [Pseudothauera rhizosphaerae]THF63267.1 bacteriohemerythrin [Pseudothauera rhizosphaerae]
MGARDSLVQWDDSYSLGLEQIDDQHKVLFDIMNHLWSAIVNRAADGEMLKILDELESYTVSHFTAEENFMQSTGYPNFDEHRKLHAQFVKRIHDARVELQQGKQISLDLLHFLRDWLVEHIQAEDRGYAKAYERGQHGGILGRFFGRLLRSS